MARKSPKSASQAQRTPGKQWTVMVYMAAGQSHELDTVAVRDLKEMERGIRGNDVNVVVQINRHWPQAAQRYRIKAANTGSELLEQLPTRTDMGNKTTLTQFVDWVAGERSFAARHFCLVLWGHAYGLGFGRDHNDPLLLLELQRALEAFRRARTASGQGNERLEILGANACAMSYIEALYQLRNVAQYMVTSQITVPFVGWPYDTILRGIRGNTSPKGLAHLIIDAYVSQFDDLPDGSRLEMSAFNLNRARDLKLNEVVDSLASAIDEDISRTGFDSSRMSFYRDVFTGATAGDVRPLIDVRRLCDGLADTGDEFASKDVREAAETFRLILEPKSPEKDPPLIERHCHHAMLDDLNGLGIFAPFVTDDEVSARLGLIELEADTRIMIERKNAGINAYKDLDLFKVGDRTGKWPDLVFKTLRRTIPAELMAAIDGVSEMRRGDRADVAQIVMAIEASLNQLDRASESASRDILTRILDSRVQPPEYRGTGQALTFGRHSLRLIPPAVKRESALLAMSTPPAASDDLVSESVAMLQRVERALSEVELTVKRGFTHARFGLGLISPGKRGLGAEPPKGGAGAEPPKGGAGAEPPKGGAGAEPPKGGAGAEPPKGGAGATGGDGNGIVSGDLRSDLAMARVADLFGDVGERLQRLETALTNVEIVTRAMLVPSPGDEPVTWAGRAEEIAYAFDLFDEESAHARRTVRYVLSHPVYGLGPGEGDLTFDVRQELARSGGLNKRQLRLLQTPVEAVTKRRLRQL